MARNIDADLSAALSASAVRPFFLTDLTFTSTTLRLWSGFGDLYAPTGATISNNGGFTGGLTGWTTVTAGTGTITGVNNTCVMVANGFQNRAFCHQTRDTVSGQRYVVKVVHTGEKLRIRVRDSVNSSDIVPLTYYFAGVTYFSFVATSDRTNLHLRNQQIGTITVDSAFMYPAETYTGAGDLMAISGFAETSDLSAQGITLSLSGMDTTIVQEARDEDYQGGQVKLRLGAFDEGGAPIDVPFEVFDGFMDVMTITDDGDSSTVSLTAENKLIRLQRSNERRYTAEDQKIKHPTDKGFEFVTKIQQAEIQWGRGTTNIGRNEFKVRDGRETEH